jgi:hypothetical protein
MEKIQKDAHEPKEDPNAPLKERGLSRRSPAQVDPAVFRSIPSSGNGTPAERKNTGRIDTGRNG